MAALMRAGLRNPFRVNVAVSSGQGADAAASTAPRKTPLSLEITYTIVPGSEKVPQLLAFLAANRDKKVIIYFLTCASVEYFSMALPSLPGGDSMPLLALHGGLKQKKVLLPGLATAPHRSCYAKPLTRGTSAAAQQCRVAWQQFQDCHPESSMREFCMGWDSKTRQYLACAQPRVCANMDACPGRRRLAVSERRPPGHAHALLRTNSAPMWTQPCSPASR